jgi:hypothetical protein
MTYRNYPSISCSQGVRDMSAESAVVRKRSETQRIAAEMDRLLEKHVELLKVESFVGLTPAQRQEYEKIGGRLHQLFGELAKLK